jgi:hypothetical protein
MIILNFTHPLTQEHITQIEALVGKVSQIIELPVQFDNEQPFCPQLEHLMAQVPLSTQALQTEPILVNLPSLKYIAALVLAHLHGRMGYFPPILRMRPAVNSVPLRFEVAEIVNLQDVRDKARRNQRCSP